MIFRGAFNFKMKQGKFISLFVSFVYEVSSEDDNKSVVDPVVAEVVKEIYALKWLEFYKNIKKLK